MLANFIICQACGCKGRAGNALCRNQSESPVFRYLGHDPFEGIMRYICANCSTMLLVSPMDMLAGICAKGVPGRPEDDLKKNQKVSVMLTSGKVLQKVPDKIHALRDQPLRSRLSRHEMKVVHS